MFGLTAAATKALTTALSQALTPALSHGEREKAGVGTTPLRGEGRDQRGHDPVWALV